MFSLYCGSRYAQTLYRLKAFEQAKQLLPPIISGFASIQGKSHRDTIVCRRLKVKIHVALGELEDARAELKSAESVLISADDNERDLQKVRRDLRKLNSQSLSSKN